MTHEGEDEDITTIRDDMEPVGEEAVIPDEEVVPDGAPALTREEKIKKAIAEAIAKYKHEKREQHHEDRGSAVADIFLYVRQTVKKYHLTKRETFDILLKVISRYG